MLNDDLSYAGLNFIKAASLDRDANHKSVSSTVEEAVKLGVSGGAMSSAMSISSSGVANVTNRAGMVDIKVADNNAYMVASNAVYSDARSVSNNGFGLWAMPMYSHTSSEGFESGEFEYGYDTDFYGVSVGADYTFDSSARLGMAFHAGSGDSTSAGDFDSTENDFNYIGLGLYTGYTWANFVLSADIAYTTTDNEVTQKTSIGNLDSDFDADVISLGARAEYKYQGNAMDITPYLAMRYSYTDIEEYTTKAAGVDAFSTESSDASVFTIPVGLNFEKEIVTESALVTPSIDLGLEFAFGDLDATQEVAIVGMRDSASMESEIYDAVTFKAGLGLDVEMESVIFNLGYDLGVSSNVTSHGVTGTLRYEF